MCVPPFLCENAMSLNRKSPVLAGLFALVEESCEILEAKTCGHDVVMRMGRCSAHVVASDGVSRRLNEVPICWWKY